MAVTTQQNARIDVDLWQRVSEKVDRIRRPEVSAGAVWVDALQRFVAETDEETSVRHAGRTKRAANGPTASKNARIDDTLWRAARRKIIHMRATMLSDAPEIDATSVWVDALERFVAETDEESIARLGGRSGARP